MQNISLDKLKQFESLMKKCLIARFGKYLPQDKISLLNSRSFIDENIIGSGLNIETAQGEVIRSIMSGVIDVRCQKEIKINGDTENVDFGEYLQEGIIEYYTQDLAEKYRININDKPELKDNLEMIALLREKLGQDLDSMVFIKTAVEILDASELEEAIKKSDTEALKEHLAQKQDISIPGKKGMAEETKDEPSLTQKERIQIVYIEGKQYIKYIDKEDQVHLIESNNPDRISELYKSALSKLDNGKDFKPEDLFKELTSVLAEESSMTSDEVNPDLLTSEEINMLDFIHSTEKYKDDLKKDDVRHFKDMKIHAIEETNDLVVTDDHDGLVESTHINDGEYNQDLSTGERELPQEQESDDEKVLTEEEYEELCMKFANNTDLTLDELRALRRSTPEEMLEREQIEEEIERRTSGPVLKLNNSNYSMAGFSNKYILAFIIIMSSCIGLILGALLFKLLH